MIIFNLGALLSAIIAVFIGALVRVFFPTLLFGQYASLSIFVLILISGSIVEIIGLAPRVFFIPVAVIGFLGTAFQLWHFWHWYSVIYSFGIVILMYMMLKILSKRATERVIQSAMVSLNDYLKETDREKKKLLILNSFIGSSFLDDDRSIKQNIETVTKILGDYGPDFSPENKIALETYVKEISNVLQKQGIKIKDIKDVKPILESVLKTSKEDIRKRELSLKNEISLKNPQEEVQKELLNAKRMARLSIVLGILSLVISVFGVVPGLILGYKAKSVLERHNIKKEIFIAKTGIVVNYAYIVLVALILVIYKTTNFMK